MGRQTPEGKTKLEIARYLEGVGIYFWYNSSVGIFDPKTRRRRKNNSPYAINGTADILGIMPDGRFLAIEVKAPNNKKGATDDQIEFINNINRRHGLAFLARSVDDVSRIIVNELLTSLPEELTN